MRALSDEDMWWSLGMCWSLSCVRFFVTPWTLARGPWDFPGKNTGVGCHFLLQGIVPIPGLNSRLLHCRQTLPSEPPGKHTRWRKEVHKMVSANDTPGTVVSAGDGVACRVEMELGSTDVYRSPQC